MVAPECPFAVIGVWPKWSQTEHPLSETTGQGVPAKMGGLISQIQQIYRTITQTHQYSDTNTPISLKLIRLGQVWWTLIFETDHVMFGS